MQKDRNAQCELQHIKDNSLQDVTDPNEQCGE